MGEIKQGFKLVAPMSSGGGSSIFAPCVQVFYKPDEWTHRPDVPVWDTGPLAVFETEEHALRWMEGFRVSYELWGCDYEPSGEEGLWSWYIEEGRGQITFDTPEGTAYAERVMLKERVARFDKVGAKC